MQVGGQDMYLYHLDDEAVRVRMVDEIRSDIDRGTLYSSIRLSATGLAEWPDLLIRAAESGGPQTLAADLGSNGRLLAYETSHRNGKPYQKKVPHDAPDTLAEGEFNRFYIRAVCAIALDRGQARVEVYRAKNVANPRTESISLVGSLVDARDLLEDLRANPGIDTALGIPPGPNSGLSVRFLQIRTTTVK
jgi:hypothetical protein